MDTGRIFRFLWSRQAKWRQAHTPKDAHLSEQVNDKQDHEKKGEAMDIESIFMDEIAKLAKGEEEKEPTRLQSALKGAGYGAAGGAAATGLPAGALGALIGSLPVPYNAKTMRRRGFSLKRARAANTGLSRTLRSAGWGVGSGLSAAALGALPGAATGGLLGALLHRSKKKE